VFQSLGTSAGLEPAGAIPLNSWHFLLVCAAAVVLMRGLPWASARKLALTCLNVYFLSLLVRAAYPLGVLCGLLLATYVLGEGKVHLADRVPQAVWTLAVVVLWAFLFLAKDSHLLGPANPFYFHPLRLVGISYLVFRSIHYLSDVECLEGRHPLTFFNYAIFFPTLLAGPIERYERFQPFFDGRDPEAPRDPLPIYHRIANGLIKKYVLADNLMAWGSLSDPPPHALAWPLLWLSVLSLLLLLYLDFSGYCDIVIGVAALMGFRLMENFNYPFLATNLQDFWNRWHISLTSIVRDYVFTPLYHFSAAHFRPRWQFAAAMAVYFFSMMLIALWHGTTWGFCVFGVLHGSMLIYLQLFRRFIYPRFGAGLREFYNHSPAVTWTARGLTYAFISVTMLFWQFGVTQSLSILGRLAGLPS
jgi:alginate O-acetyltransferase complex protein AlgI